MSRPEGLSSDGTSDSLPCNQDQSTSKPVYFSLVQVTQLTSCSLCEYMCECSDRSPKCIKIIMSCPEGLSSDGTSDSLPCNQDQSTSKPVYFSLVQVTRLTSCSLCEYMCECSDRSPKCIKKIMSCPEGLSSDGTSDSLPCNQDQSTSKPV